MGGLFPLTYLTWFKPEPEPKWNPVKNRLCHTRQHLTEVVWRSQRGEDTGEELQTDLDLGTVAVPAVTQQRETALTLSKQRGNIRRPNCFQCFTLCCISAELLTDLQCKLVPVFTHFHDVVLQVVEEQLHHLQLLLGPPDGSDTQAQCHRNWAIKHTGWLLRCSGKRYLHSDPVGVVAGAKLLKSAKKFW